MEKKHDELAKEVVSLTKIVNRVEQNQEHATELNKLRFDALDLGVKSVSGQLTDFIRRIDGVLTGEIETTQTRAGREVIEDYKEWRGEVDHRLDDQDVLNGQVRLLGRLAVILIGSNALTIIGAVAYYVSNH